MSDSRNEFQTRSFKDLSDLYAEEVRPIFGMRRERRRWSNAGPTHCWPSIAASETIVGPKSLIEGLVALPSDQKNGMHPTGIAEGSCSIVCVAWEQISKYIRSPTVLLAKPHDAGAIIIVRPRFSPNSNRPKFVSLELHQFCKRNFPVRFASPNCATGRISPQIRACLC